MKRTLMISVIAALCFAACGEKSDLKARAQKGNPPGAGQSKVEGAFVFTEDSDLRKLPADTKATRNVIAGDATAKTTILCAKNLEEAFQKEKERIKVLGGSQLMFSQDDGLPIPETVEALGQKTEADAKKIVNIVCETPATATGNIEKMKNVTKLTITAGESEVVSGKFDTETNESQNLSIGCATDADLANAYDILYPDPGYPINMLMSLKSQVLIETDPTKTGRQFVLVTCKGAEAKAMETPTPTPTEETIEAEKTTIQEKAAR